MSDLLDFIATKEVISVCFVVLLSSALCFIIYYVEKNNDRLRKKHNTKELNKLVDQINEEYPEEVIEEDPDYNKPVVLSTVDDNSLEIRNVDELVNTTLETKVDEGSKEVVEVEEEVDEELEYTTIEPDQATARLELQKLTEELLKQEELFKQEELEKEQPVLEPIVEENIVTEELSNEESVEINEYEDNQEKTAIISLDELIEKGRELYEANEETQYADEGNEPISIQDLEERLDKKVTQYDEPFVIANVVPQENSAVEVNQESSNETSKKFKNSPIISPIFGIEREVPSDNSLELENTANYEKLDDEIKKTNEFLMTLKELQKKLD